MEQQQRQSAFDNASFGHLLELSGLAAQFSSQAGGYPLYGDPLSAAHLRGHSLYDSTRAQQAYKYPRVARIGKVTPKPGVIKDWTHPDRYRWKIMSDYKWWERVVIWFQT